VIFVARGSCGRNVARAALTELQKALLCKSISKLRIHFMAEKRHFLDRRPSMTSLLGKGGLAFGPKPDLDKPSKANGDAKLTRVAPTANEHNEKVEELLEQLQDPTNNIAAVIISSVREVMNLADKDGTQLQRMRIILDESVRGRAGLQLTICSDRRNFEEVAKMKAADPEFKGGWPHESEITPHTWKVSIIPDSSTVPTLMA
jgi:hypothetical protein